MDTATVTVTDAVMATATATVAVPPTAAPGMSRGISPGRGSRGLFSLRSQGAPGRRRVHTRASSPRAPPGPLREAPFPTAATAVLPPVSGATSVTGSVTLPESVSVTVSGSVAVAVTGSVAVAVTVTGSATVSATVSVAGPVTVSVSATVTGPPPLSSRAERPEAAEPRDLPDEAGTHRPQTPCAGVRDPAARTRGLLRPPGSPLGGAGFGGDDRRTVPCGAVTRLTDGHRCGVSRGTGQRRGPGGFPAAARPPGAPSRRTRRRWSTGAWWR